MIKATRLAASEAMFCGSLTGTHLFTRSDFIFQDNSLWL